MIHPRVFRTAGASGLLALALAGCMQFGPPPPPRMMVIPPAPPPSSAPDDEMSAIQARIRDLEEELRTNREGSGGRDSLLDRIEDDKDANLQQRGALADGYVKVARKYYGELDWSRAKENLQRALEVDPEHAEAKKLLEDTQSAMGEHVRGDMGSIVRNEQDRLSVKMQEAQLSLQNHFNEGVRLFDSGTYDKAIEEFTRVVEGAKWLPGDMDLGGLDKQAEDYLGRARKMNEEKEVVDRRKREEMIGRLAEEEEHQRKEIVVEKIKRLFEEAQKDFEAGDYERAEQLCSRLMETDPNNPHAKELFQISRAAKHAKADKRNLEVYLEEWRRQFESIDLKTIPYGEDVVFPDREEWEKISARGPVRAGGEQEEMAPEDLIVENQLRQPYPLNFFEVPLSGVVEILRDFTKLNINIEKSVPNPEEPITFKVDGYPLGEGLRLMLEGYNFAYKIEDGIIKITTKEDVDNRTIFQMYNVHDLTGSLNDFPAPELDLATGSATPDAGTTAPPPQVGSEELLNLVKENIAKGTWDTPPNSIDFNNNVLLVRHTPATQKQIRALLDDLRKSTGMIVSIEARFMTVEEHFLHDVGIDWRGLDAVTDRRQTNLDDFQTPPYGFFTAEQNAGGASATPLSGVVSSYSGGDISLRSRIENLLTNDQLISNFFSTIYSNSGGASMQFTLIDPTLVEAIVRAVEKHQRARLLTAPKITVFNTQRANIFVANQFTYIKDYDVEVANNAVIANPTPGTVQDGISLDVRPTISADRKYITLELRPTVAVLDPPPVATGIYPLFVQTFLGQNTDQTLVARVQIETPQLRIQRVRTTVTVPDGGTLLVGGLTNVYDDRINSGVPVASDIPILNTLFDRKVDAKRKRSLLIMIRAKILIMDELEARRTNQ